MPVGYRGVVVASSVAALALVAVTACGGAGKYAGSYKRELYGEGDVLMKLGSDGTVELTLPAPRWADSPNMTGKASFKGDTLVFPADTAMQVRRRPKHATSSARTAKRSRCPVWAWTAAVPGTPRSRGPGRRADRLAAQAAGHCWVTQWKAPSPQTRSVQSMTTMRRSGKRRWSVRAAFVVPLPVVSGKQHDAVGDVEVRVARRQALAVVEERRRHRQQLDPERPAILIRHAPEAAAGCPAAARSSRPPDRPRRR